MVMAAWVKKRQFRQGLQQGREEGRAEERERANAKLRAWAKEKGIPVEELPLESEKNPKGTNLAYDAISVHIDKSHSV